MRTSWLPSEYFIPSPCSSLQMHFLSFFAFLSHTFDKNQTQSILQGEDWLIARFWPFNSPQPILIRGLVDCQVSASFFRRRYHYIVLRSFLLLVLILIWPKIDTTNLPKGELADCQVLLSTLDTTYPHKRTGGLPREYTIDLPSLSSRIFHFFAIAILLRTSILHHRYLGTCTSLPCFTFWHTWYNL